jgi:hypothetical protein
MASIGRTARNNRVADLRLQPANYPRCGQAEGGVMLLTNSSKPTAGRPVTSLTVIVSRFAPPCRCARFASMRASAQKAGGPAESCQPAPCHLTARQTIARQQLRADLAARQSPRAARPRGQRAERGHLALKAVDDCRRRAAVSNHQSKSAMPSTAATSDPVAMTSAAGSSARSTESAHHARASPRCARGSSRNSRFHSADFQGAVIARLYRGVLTASLE